MGVMLLATNVDAEVVADTRYESWLLNELKNQDELDLANTVWNKLSSKLRELD